jgi:hypothetical protein
VLLLDYLFDGQPHGGQLIRALKARPATAQLPILVCTGVQAELPYFHTAGIGLLAPRAVGVRWRVRLPVSCSCR